MLILTAPAKTLNQEGTLPSLKYSQPLLLKHAAIITHELQQLSAPELGTLLKTNDALTALNFKRYQQWNEAHSLDNSRPALWTYAGHIFKQIPVDTYNTKQLQYAQESLCILSGLYGVLRPLDLMQPYRLEMNTKLGNIGPLRAFWKQTLTKQLQQNINAHNHQFILNVASKEYSDAIDLKALSIPTINVIFLQTSKGVTKTFAMLAKQARGQMIDFCITHQVETVEQLTKFNVDGYRLQSTSTTEVVFLKV
jgi:cytoplasmic iron level regulating protein YaaA (DUF328/UPF0246 family)